MWIDPERPDERAVAGAVAVLEAGRVADSPHELPPTVTSFVAEIRHGWDGEPPLAAVSRDGSGRVVGVLQLSMPERDNRHLGYVEVCVDPVVRRSAVGRFLVGAAIERLRAEGRTLLLVGGWDTPHGTAFAKALGLDAAMAEVKRRQDLRRLDTARLDRLYAEAELAAADYELFRMPRPIPDELMPGVVTMVAAINDAPLDELDVEHEVFTPERLRGFEAAQDAHRRRMHQLVARHKESGVLAGHTIVGVESDRPWYGDQFDTSVLREHRGHRLGLLLKIGMLRWLAEVEPQLRMIDTWNAGSNEHMIAVNETLGYEVVATSTEYQRHL